MGFKSEEEMWAAWGPTMTPHWNSMTKAERKEWQEAQWEALMKRLVEEGLLEETGERRNGKILYRRTLKGSTAH